MKTKIRNIFIVVLPILLFLVPLDWLTSRQTICPINILFHKECYGCGITRAIFSVLHLDFKTAYQYNKLIVFVFPLLIYIWFKSLKTLLS